MPLRSSSAGDSIEPQADDDGRGVHGQRRGRAVGVGHRRLDAGRAAVLEQDRSAWQPDTTRAPASEASCSQVFIAERLQPCWQPSGQWPQNSGSSSSDALRQIGRCS